MHQLPGIRRIASVAMLASLASCGGGGGDRNEAVSVTLSTRAVAFSAASPAAAAPAPQVVTATFGSSVAQLSVVHTGSAIERVSYTLSGKTAEITIHPAAPGNTGAGNFTSSVAVTGYACADASCTTLAPGTTDNLSVSYLVSPAAQHVAPYVGVAGTGGVAIIRGAGLNAFALQAVRFGTVAATASTVTSGTEIRATYPALAAGVYPIELDFTGHPGVIVSTTALRIIDPTAFAAGTLAYPAGTTAVRKLLYDAERSALVLATDAGGGSVVRYSYAGGAWGAPETVAVNTLQDVALSTDGAQLLALSRTNLTPINASTLVAGTPVAPASLPTNGFLKNLAVANSNDVVVTSGIAESANTVFYFYDADAASFLTTTLTSNNGTPTASGDGSLIAIVQGDPSLTNAPAVLQYTASTGNLSATSATLNQNAIPPAINRDGARVVLNGRNVYDAIFALLGTLPETTSAVAVRADGQRVYTYDASLAALRIFNISATASGQAYTALGNPVPVVADPGSGVRMTISADGQTLFLAGGSQLVIQPTPSDP